MRDQWLYLVLAEIATRPFLTLVLIGWLWFTGTIFFDIVHWVLHQCSKSSWHSLRLLGSVHQVHHFYFNRRLEFNNRYRVHNLCVELPLELGCQLFGTWLGWVAARDSKLFQNTELLEGLSNLVRAVELGKTLVVAALSGQDSNHKSYTTVPKNPNWIIVGPEYHSLHHVDPAANIGSLFRVFDWLFGTGYSLRGRRIAMTGASGAFGKAMKKLLRAEPITGLQELKFGRDWTYKDFTSAIPTLAETDILILAHGTGGKDSIRANCESVITFVKLFKKHRKSNRMYDMLLPEIWYVGSEIELHPSWGILSLQQYSRSKRLFLPHARKLYDDPSILYRHIVPAAFQSPMGPAIVSGDWAARVAMWWIRRGAQYVPVTYTGIAYINFFKFRYLVNKC